MSPSDAHAIVAAELEVDAGRFYFQGGRLSLGVGKFYSGVLCPHLNLDDMLYDTVEATTMVLSHECDVDQANDRPFNDFVLVCPIISFEVFVEEYSARLGDEQLRGFLVNLAHRAISRVLYLPWGLTGLPMGGLLYLNQIVSTHVSAFSRDGVGAIGAASAYGLHIFDQVLTNHLLRPKSERLAFDRTEPPG